MSRTITLAVTSDDDPGATATVKLKVGNGGWTKTEPGGANIVFHTASGPYNVVGGNSIELLRSGGGTRIGRLASLDPIGVGPNGSGSGLSDDAGVSISWRVTSIVN